MKHSYFSIPDVFSLEECRQIVEKLEVSKTAKNEDLPASHVIKSSKVKVMDYGHVRSLLYRMHQIVTHANNTIFGFSVYEKNDYESIFYNKYNSNNHGEYGWHGDQEFEKPYDLKLTALLNLSTSPYTGGQFELFVNGPLEVPYFDKPGCLVVFPSWIQHRVTPVTDGERVSLSHFYMGPSLK
jgi:PKHD-type hydroxylase